MISTVLVPGLEPLRWTNGWSNLRNLRMMDISQVVKFIGTIWTALTEMLPDVLFVNHNFGRILRFSSRHNAPKNLYPGRYQHETQQTDNDMTQPVKRGCFYH